MQYAPSFFEDQNSALESGNWLRIWNTLSYLITVHVRLFIFKIFEPKMKKNFLKKQYYHKHF